MSTAAGGVAFIGQLGSRDEAKSGEGVDSGVAGVASGCVAGEGGDSEEKVALGVAVGGVGKEEGG
jgi:hypothetical protein